MIRLALLFVFVTACVSKPKVAEQPTDKIRVMTFNVENLFDLENDPEKNDDAFLPLSSKRSAEAQNRCRAQNSATFRQEECLGKDWSRLILERKLHRLTDVIKQVNNGMGPDILLLQEVENIKVLEFWRDKYLQNMNYQTIALIDGPDERGIDTAIMSRLPLVGEPKLHEIDFSKDPEINPNDIRPTRGIIEARLRLPTGGEIATLSVHFPAQGAPTGHRKAAAQALVEVAKNIPAGIPVIVGGDFNITSTEDWQNKYFKNILAEQFLVSHLEGCKGCAGTTYYPKDKTWSFFDVLLFSKDLKGKNSQWRLNKDSIRIVNSSVYQFNRWGTPARFGTGKGAVGVSDHWPVYAELELQNSDAGAAQ